MGKKGGFCQWFDSFSEEEKTAYSVDLQDAREQGSIVQELEKEKRCAAIAGKRAEIAGCEESHAMPRRPRPRRAANRSASPGGTRSPGSRSRAASCRRRCAAAACRHRP